MAEHTPLPGLTADQAAVLDAMPTAALKRLVAHRVAADAATLINQEEHHVSRKADAQRRAAARDAKHDQKHWKAEKAKYESKPDADPRGSATYQRAIDRLQRTIDRNS